MATLRSSCRVLQGRACCTIVLYQYLNEVSWMETCKQLLGAHTVHLVHRGYVLCSLPFNLWI